MDKAAKQYLDIIKNISSQLDDFRQKMPDTFESIPVMILPQDMKNDVDDPTEMVQQLVILYQTSVADKEALGVKVDDLQNRNALLSAQVKIKDEWYRTADQRLKASEAELCKLQKEPDEKVKEMEIQVNEHIKLVSAITNSEAESTPTMQEEIHNLKMKLELANAEKRTLEQEQETTTVVMNKLTDEIEQLLTFKVQAQSKIATTEQQKYQLQELREENIKLYQRLKNTTGNVDMQQNTENIGYGEHEKQVSKVLQDESSRLQQDLSLKSSEMLRLKDENEELIAKLKTNNENEQSYKDEQQNLIGKLEKSEAENNRLEQELASITAVMTELTNENETLLLIKQKIDLVKQWMAKHGNAQLLRLQDNIITYDLHTPSEMEI